MNNNIYGKAKLKHLIQQYEMNQLRLGDIQDHNHSELKRAQHMNKVIEEEIKALTLDEYYKTNKLDNSYLINPKKHPGTHPIKKGSSYAVTPTESEMLSQAKPIAFSQGKLYYNQLNESDFLNNTRSYNLDKPNINNTVAMADSELKETINNIKKYGTPDNIQRTELTGDKNINVIEGFTAGMNNQKKILDSYNSNANMLPPSPFAVGLNVPVEEHGIAGTNIFTKDYMLRDIAYTHPNPYVRNEAKNQIGKLPVRKFNMS